MIVIGCGKAKLDRRAKARELYTGSLFMAARRYAEAREQAHGERWAILSAKHGLVLPDEELDPYDAIMKLRGLDLQSWALRSAVRCEQELVKAGAARRVECLAGHPYAWPFRNELHWFDIPSTEPLEGLGLGHRLQWLSQSTAGLRGGSTEGACRV